MTSQFQNQPIPANRDNQDYERLLAPGATVEIPAIGDFVYCKIAESEIRVVINGKTTRMEAGDTRRTGSTFRGVQLFNESENPVRCVFVIGFGEFDRTIVRGEITAELKLRTANGEYVDDTRKTLPLDLIQVPGSGFTETQGQFITSFFNGGSSDWNFTLANGQTFNNPIWFEYNPKIHDGINVLGQQASNNAYYALEIDPVTGQVIRDLGPIADLGQPESACRFGNTIYQRNGFNQEGVWKNVNGSGWEFVFANTASNQAMTIDEDENIYIGSNDFILKFDKNGNQLASVNTLERVQTLAWHNGELWRFNSGLKPRVYNKDLDFIRQLPNNQGITAGVIYGNYLFELANDDTIRVEAIETVTDLFAGRAFLECENAWLGFRPNEFNAVRTSADIEVTNAKSGNPTVSGELLKLIVEWYLGEQVDSTYLDFIYGIEIYGSTDSNGVSYPPIIIKSEGQTFLAADIVDDFTMIFPINAKITIDQRAGV